MRWQHFGRESRVVEWKLRAMIVAAQYHCLRYRDRALAFGVCDDEEALTDTGRFCYKTVTGQLQLGIFGLIHGLFKTGLLFPLILYYVLTVSKYAMASISLSSPQINQIHHRDIGIPEPSRGR